jgi:hypothetical protein
VVGSLRCLLYVHYSWERSFVFLSRLELIGNSPRFLTFCFQFGVSVAHISLIILFILCLLFIFELWDVQFCFIEAKVCAFMEPSHVRENQIYSQSSCLLFGLLTTVDLNSGIEVTVREGEDGDKLGRTCFRH